jgi:hypothetical protein
MDSALAGCRRKSDIQWGGSGSGIQWVGSHNSS